MKTLSFILILILCILYCCYINNISMQCPSIKRMLYSNSSYRPSSYRPSSYRPSFYRPSSYRQQDDEYEGLNDLDKIPINRFKKPKRVPDIIKSRWLGGLASQHKEGVYEGMRRGGRVVPNDVEACIKTRDDYNKQEERCMKLIKKYKKLNNEAQ